MSWLWLILALPGMAGDWDYTINSDTFAAYQEQPLLNQGHDLASTRLRLNGTWNLSEHWQWEGAYEGQFLHQQHLLLNPFPVFLRYDDLKPSVSEGENHAVLQQLDRFKLTWEQGRWRASLGRQAVGHGNGRYFNPSDLFAPLSPFSLNSQYKAGIDGLRVTRALGVRSEVELLAFLPERGEGVWLGHISTNFREVDLSILAGQTYGEWTAAWDLATTAAGAAWYSEGVWRKGEQRKSPLRAMAGFSRRYGTKTDVLAEYHYQNTVIDGLLPLLFNPEFLHGERYLMQRHHLAMGVSYEAHPLVAINASVMAETSDASARWLLGLSWDVSMRSSLVAGILHASGPRSSEFGANSDAAYAELRLTLP